MSVTTIKIIVSSQYGNLSRGRHSARKKNGNDTIWADKTSNGNLLITEAGTWHLHCSDGFNRIAKATITIKENGHWEMNGDVKRFDVIS